MFDNKSILEITSLIKSKEILVKDVVEFYLERIKKYNPTLNAIVLQKEEEKIFFNLIGKIFFGKKKKRSVRRYESNKEGQKIIPTNNMEAKFVVLQCSCSGINLL